MKDFDWYGGHEDLDQWWVNTWLWYICEFGIDGYRIDVAHYRNDLWALIRKKAAQMGRNIMIVAESGPAIKGVTDILRHGEVISHNYGLNQSGRILSDVAGYIKDRQIHAGEHYDVKIFYEEGTVQDSSQQTWYQDLKVPVVIWEQSITKKIEDEKTGSAYQMQMGMLRVENIYGEKKIQNIQIRDKQGQMWNSCMTDVLEVDYMVLYQGKRNGLHLEFPLPVLSPKLFGGENFGKGRWLYGSWLDWEQLKNPEKACMLEDVKQIIRIRRKYSHLIYAYRMGEQNQEFGSVEYEGLEELPAPYFYREENRAIVVCANQNPDKDCSLYLKLQDVLSNDKTWQATVLFGALPIGGIRLSGTAEELSGICWNIRKDKSSQGGLLVLEFKK